MLFTQNIPANYGNKHEEAGAIIKSSWPPKMHSKWQKRGESNKETIELIESARRVLGSGGGGGGEGQPPAVEGGRKDEERNANKEQDSTGGGGTSAKRRTRHRLTAALCVNQPK